MIVDHQPATLSAPPDACVADGLAVLTTGDPTEQYGIDTIDALSAMVWRRM